MTDFPLTTAAEAERFLTEFARFAEAFVAITSLMEERRRAGEGFTDAELDEATDRQCAKAGIDILRFYEIAALDREVERAMLTRAADLAGLTRAGRKLLLGLDS